MKEWSEASSTLHNKKWRRWEQSSSLKRSLTRSIAFATLSRTICQSSCSVTLITLMAWPELLCKFVDQNSGRVANFSFTDCLADVPQMITTKWHTWWWLSHLEQWKPFTHCVALNISSNRSGWKRARRLDISNPRTTSGWATLAAVTNATFPPL